MLAINWIILPMVLGASSLSSPSACLATFTYSPSEHTAPEHSKWCVSEAKGALRFRCGKRKHGEQGHSGRGRAASSACVTSYGVTQVWGEGSFPLPFKDLPAGLIIKATWDRVTRKITKFNCKRVYGNPTYRGGSETKREDGVDRAFWAKDAIWHPGLQGEESD